MINAIGLGRTIKAKPKRELSQKDANERHLEL